MAPSLAPEGQSAPSVPPVFLHIGTMKSGTTFLQRVLIDNREQLAAAGYLFPGAQWKAQIRAAQDVTRRTIDDPVFRAEAEGAWRALTQEMLDHRGAASVVSMEFLADAGRRQARSATTSLAPADVHVVLTVRDATRTIPSHWQTFVKSKGTIGWHDFRAGVRKARGIQARIGRFSNRPAAEFRRIHDVSRVLGAWGPSVHADRLHVVTVPPSSADPTLLWRRFAGVVGLDPELGSGAAPANESLGYASTELLRRVNLALADVPLHDHFAIVREHLANRILTQRSKEEAKPRLDQQTFDFGLGWNVRSREAVTRLGAQVAGDLDDLPTAPTEHHSAAVDDTQRPPRDEELLAAAQTATAGMQQLLDRQRRRAIDRGLEADTSHDVSPAADGADSGDPVSTEVARIAALCRSSIELRRRIRA